MKIYMAGALMTAAEREWNREVARGLRKYGYEVFLPQENESVKTEDFNAAEIFGKDVAGIEWCDVVLGWIEGPIPIVELAGNWGMLKERIK